VIETAPNNRPRKLAKQLVALVAMITFSIAALLACIIMAGLMAIAFAEYFHAWAIFFWNAPYDTSLQTRDRAALEGAIRATEFLFLAPVGYLVTLALAKYVYASVSETRAAIAYAEAEVLRVKSFVIGLLIAIVAANAVGRALTAKGVTLAQSGALMLIIGVLALLFFALQLWAAHVSREQPALRDATDALDDDGQ